MDSDRARRIRAGLDTAAGAFWICLGGAAAIVVVALTLIGLGAVAALLAKGM